MWVYKKCDTPFENSFELGYINYMKSNREPNLEEFKFHYHFENAVGHSDKYFLAHNIDEAKDTDLVGAIDDTDVWMVNKAGDENNIPRKPEILLTMPI